jgi:hypothetical protein
VAAAWQGATGLTALFPGETRTTPLLRVTGSGQGATLRWQLETEVAVSDAFRPWVRTQVWAGPCAATGSPLLADVTGATARGVYTEGAGLLPGRAVDLCIRFSLLAGAPQDLRGVAVAPTVTVAAVQRGA